jgi:hypothetical protein
MAVIAGLPARSTKPISLRYSFSEEFVRPIEPKIARYLAGSRSLSPSKQSGPSQDLSQQRRGIFPKQHPLPFPDLT